MAEQERESLHSRLDLIQRQLDELRHELQRVRQEVASRAVGPVEEPATGKSPKTSRAHVEPPAQPQPLSAQPRRPSLKPRQAEGAATAAERRKMAIDLEFWLGGRGLLLLGVIAGVLAVGLFAKEAIERGWIGPATRVLTAGGVGIAAVIVGERIRARGYRIYGLWLSAGGFSAVYLSIWAAAALYSLVSSSLGFFLMVVVVAIAATLGLLCQSQSFVALAAFGGYLAPVLLPVETASNVFGLGYLALLSGAGILVAQRGRWIYLSALAVAGGLLLPLANQGDPVLHGFYLVVLVAIALAVARQRQWHHVSSLAVLLGWVALWLGSGDWGIDGVAYAGFAAAVWAANLIAALGIKDWVATADAARESEETVVDRPALRQGPDTILLEFAGLFLTLVPPWFFLLTATHGIENSVYSDWSGEVGFGLSLALGAVYAAQAIWIGPGIGAGSRLWPAAAGLALWIVAPSLLWEAIGVTRAWLIEGVVFTVLGVWRGWLTSRAAGLAVFVLAALGYWGTAAGRSSTDPAFFSGFALTGLATCAGLLAWPLAVARAERAAAWESAIRPVVLLGAAVLFLGWGTSEISRFYALLGEVERWALARDLSISAFWLAYAAALLALGFRLQQAPVRWAGLAMALIAAGKVFLYDLSQLSQLYRIASFVLLALVLLALSYRYQRWRRYQS